MADDTLIRRATVDDVPVIVRHRRAMFTDMGHTDPAALAAMEASFAPYLARALDDGLYRGWLAQTQDGCVIASGGLIVHEWPSRPVNPAEPRRAYILNVYTEPEYRGRGIARRIMRDIVEWCRALGFRSVSLHASVFGRPLYESMGFEPTNEMRLGLQDNEITR
jgi:GNAT superfamily N-acetyltransferase